MDRLLIALLSAFDALLAAAVGIAAALAPLTLIWVIALAGDADWGALWPTSGSIWQLGHLVPLPITLDDAYVVQTGIAVDAASFTLSLAPLAFAAFTTIFAARSGARAAGAGAWITGVASGALAFAAIALAVALTTSNPIATPALWQAVLLPFGLYGASALVGAVVAAWRGGDDGLIDGLRRRLDLLPHGWGEVPSLIARGTAIALAGLVGAASILVAVSVLLAGDEVVALYESTHLDALGATVVTLGQLAYLPTLIVWALSWLAGPGFAIGVGTAVSPAGTQLGVVPGIPMLGLIPEGGSEWLLLVLLVPVAAGSVAGWAIRSRMVTPRTTAPVAAVAAPRIELMGLIPTAPIVPPIEEPAHEHEPIGPRLAATAGIGLLAGAFAAVLARAASGSLGPGRLAEVGPSAGPVALAVGAEVLVGAAILLLGPQAKPRPKKSEKGRRGTKWWARKGRGEDQPVGREKPVPTAAPATTAEPAFTAEPALPEEPAVTAEPALTVEPASTAGPATTAEAASTVQPAAPAKLPTTAVPAPTPKAADPAKLQGDANPWALLSRSKAAKGRDVDGPVPAAPDENEALRGKRPT